MAADLSRKAPWEAFPTIPWGSIGWRMGPGEEYMDEWSRFFDKLTEESRMSYQASHPEPDRWIGFYAMRNAKYKKSDEREAVLRALVHAQRTGKPWRESCQFQLKLFNITLDEVETGARRTKE